MRFTAVALVGFAALATAQEIVPDAAAPGTMVAPDNTVQGGDIEADDVDPDASNLFKGPFGFPPGLSKPSKKKDLPHLTPPKEHNKGKDGLPVWHPPHKGVFIDDCDDDKDDKWHWAHKGKKHPKPIIPHHKWTTSTVTATKTKTVFDCPDKVPDCPGKPKTKFTTTTVEVTTTICPVPITDVPKPKPHPPKPEGHPPKPPLPPHPTKPAPPSGPGAPPAPPSVTAPPTAPELPEYSKPPVIVEAGAAHNSVGALAAVAAFFALLI